MERKDRLSSLLTRKYLVIPKLFVPFLVFTQEKSATVDVTSITLDPATASMTLGGETLTLTPTVLPADATDKTVTWTTSNASVATVADGIVTAVAAGTVTITANANDGSGVTDTCTVTVTAPATKDNIDVTAGENGTWTFTMPEANVWVKDAGTLAAGKCWIELVPSSPAHTGRIVFDDYTAWRNIFAYPSL